MSWRSHGQKGSLDLPPGVCFPHLTYKLNVSHLEHCDPTWIYFYTHDVLFHSKEYRSIVNLLTADYSFWGLFLDVDSSVKLGQQIHSVSTTTLFWHKNKIYDRWVPPSRQWHPFFTILIDAKKIHLFATIWWFWAGHSCELSSSSTLKIQPMFNR